MPRRASPTSSKSCDSIAPACRVGPISTQRRPLTLRPGGATLSGEHRGYGMHGIRSRVVVVAFVAVSLAGCTWIQRSSVSSSPDRVEGNLASGQPSLSQTGRFVAFDSLATNLVAGDTNGVADVFVRDHTRGTTERVSIATDETQADGASRNAAISDDGRFVAFETDATNLFAGDGDGESDILLRDRQLGTTTLVSLDAAGLPILDAAFAPVISGDGNVVAFTVLTSFQAFCCLRDGPYVRTITAGTTKRMPDAPGGFFQSGHVSLSDDGSRIVYGHLAPIGDDAIFGVVVSDTASATVVTGVFSGHLTHQSQGFFDQAISGDGGTVVVTLAAPGVGVGEVHTFDVDQRSLVKILDELYFTPAVSDDGSVIALRRVDGAGYEVTSSSGAAPRVVSADARGTPATSIDGTDLSGNGKFVAFGSADPQLVRRDTNGVPDVFTRAVRSPFGP